MMFRLAFVGMLMLGLAILVPTGVDAAHRIIRLATGQHVEVECVSGIPPHVANSGPSGNRVLSTCLDFPPSTPTAVVTVVVVTATTEPSPTPSPLPTVGPTNTAPPPATPQPTATPNPGVMTVVVPDDYPTIAAAIAVVPPGATIRLRAGTYPVVSLDKTGLTLTAYGDGPVIIDGGCVADWGIAIYADDVTVDGLTVQNVVIAGVGIGNGLARMQVLHNTIQDFNCQDRGEQFHAGIAAWYAGPGHTIVGNTITRRVNLPGSQRGAGNGIWFKSNSTDRASGGGHEITDNIITGGYDGIGGEVEDDIHGGFDRDTLIARNTITDCADDGIQVEGGSVNIHIVDNVVRECGSQVAFAPNLIGPLYVERNDLASSTPGSDYGVLSCFKVGNGGSGTTYLTGNTCRMGPGGDGIKQTNAGLSPIVAQDNVLVVGRYVVEYSSALPDGMELSGGCLETTDPTRFISWGGARYDDLTAFQAATGQGADTQQGGC